MRFAHLAVLACAAAALAACQDNPTAQKSPAALKSVSAAQLARLGVTPPAAPTRVGQRPRAYVGCIEYPDQPPCEPQARPMADFDYGASTDPFYQNGFWWVHRRAWSAAYSHIASMTLDADYTFGNTCSSPDEVVASGHTSATGSPASIELNDYAGSSSSFKAGIHSYHYFQASPLYTVDGYLNADTFEAGSSYCIP